MTIQVGEQLPAGTVKQLIDGSPVDVEIQQLFAGKKGVLFAVPGAFTPGCSKVHLPSYVEKYDAIRAEGFDVIVCLAVNDAWVMDAWGQAHGTKGKVLMLADGSVEYTKKLGLVLDLTDAGLGLRSKRYSMIIENGTVKTLNIDEKSISTTTASGTCGI